MSENELEREIQELTAEEAWRNAVSVRAYRLWQREGSPDGVRSDGQAWAEHFWLRAETQMRENGFG
jgi:Protein of unknown function (DUF2934)